MLVMVHRYIFVLCVCLEAYYGVISAFFFIAFETSRKEARTCKQEFEQVKKRRYELFSRCFEHASIAIDQIYKKLCRNSSAQVCHVRRCLA